jgi:outer membrane lipase/esterase
MIGRASIACTLVLALTGPVAARPFRYLWVFGDSTVDTGWYRKSPYSGDASYDFYIKQPVAAVGRPTSSPGLMSVEVLAEVLELGARPANGGGTDYATGGARDHDPNTATSGGFPNAVPTETQITLYILQHGRGLLPIFSPPNLYVISSGGNDVASAIKNAGSTNPDTAVTSAANALAAKIRQLTIRDRNGAIIVVGLPESFGTAEQQQYRQLHDVTLRAALDAAHVSYAWADLNGVRKLIESFEGQATSPFNISHYTTANPACPKPSTSLNPTVTTDWAYVCSPSNLAATQPANAAASEFADDAHWATGAQAVLGSYLYCLARAKWPGRPWFVTKRLPFACSNFSTLK